MGAERNRVTVIFCAIFHSLVSRTLLYRLYRATPSSICARCSHAVSLVAVSNTIFIQQMENVDQRRWRTVDSVADRAGFVDNEPSRKERLACHETQTFASMSPVFHSWCSFHRCFFRTFASLSLRSPGRRKISRFDEEAFECARRNVPQRYMRNCYQVHLHRINARAKLLHSHANGPIVKYSCRLIGLHGITPGVCNKIIICRPRCIFRRLLIVYRIWLISILDARRSIDY